MRRETKRNGIGVAIGVALVALILCVLLIVLECCTPYKPSNGFKPTEQTEELPEGNGDSGESGSGGTNQGNQGGDESGGNNGNGGTEQGGNQGNNQGSGTNTGDPEEGKEQGGEGGEEEKPVPPAGKYTVTYVSGNALATGTAPASEEHAEGDRFNLIICPFELEGHRFTGWSDGSRVYGEMIEYEMQGRSVVFTAQWSELPAAKYTVRYERGREEATGEDPSAAEYKAGETVRLPACPYVLTGYDFIGWTDGEEVYAAKSQYEMQGRNVTFTAVWEEHEAAVRYTVSYSRGTNEYATGDAPQGGEYEVGTLFEVAACTFNGHDYAFKGWSDGLDLYQAGDDYEMPAHAVTFVAQWEQVAPLKYQATFERGNEAATGDDPVILPYAAGENFALPACPYVLTGYAFIGWSDGTVTLAAGTAYTMPEGGVTLVAQWDRRYTVSYQSGNAAAIGKAPTSREYAAGIRFSLPSNPFLLTDYKFTGWQGSYEVKNALTGKTETFTTDVYPAGASFVMLEYDITFTATWELAPEKYTVSYESGNSLATGTAPTVREYEVGAEVTLSVNPFTLTDYKFAGWTDGAKTYAAGASYEMPRKNVTFTATWEPVVRYKATYQSGNASATGTAPLSREYEAGTAFFLPSNPYSLSGYEFDGWSDGSKVYGAGAKYTMPENNVTFAATWKLPPEKYTVTYVRGNAAATGTDPAPVQAEAGKRITLPSNPYTLAGYDFDGWSDGATTYSAGASYTMRERAVTFAAQWERAHSSNDFEQNHDGDQYANDRADGFTCREGTDEHSLYRHEYDMIPGIAFAERCTCGLEQDYYTYVFDSAEFDFFESVDWDDFYVYSEPVNGTYSVNFRFDFSEVDYMSMDGYDHKVSDLVATGNIERLDYKILDGGYVVEGRFEPGNGIGCGAIRIYMGIPPEDLNVQLNGATEGHRGTTVRGPRLDGSYLVTVNVAFGYSVEYYQDCGGGVFKTLNGWTNEPYVVVIEKEYDYASTYGNYCVVFELEDGKVIDGGYFDENGIVWWNMQWGLTREVSSVNMAEVWKLDYSYEEMRAFNWRFTIVGVYCSDHGEYEIISKRVSTYSGGLSVADNCDFGTGEYFEDNGGWSAGYGEKHCVLHVVLRELTA